MRGVSRPSIPSPLKRAVRQRCGFGCVVCGVPLYHYEHMVAYHVVKVHEPDNLTLLCDRHHREKTSGLLPISDVRGANADPYNLRSGRSAPLSLHYSGEGCEARIGGVSHEWPVLPSSGLTTALLVDNVPIVAFMREDNQLLLTIQLFGAQNEHVVQVLDNELIYSVGPWDVEMESRRLTIRSAPRDIFVSIEFTPPSLVDIQRGHFYCNGYEFKVAPNSFDTGRGYVEDLQVRGLANGVGIGNMGSAVCGIGLPASQKPHQPFSRPVRIIFPSTT